MKLRRPLYGPDDPRGPSRGQDVVMVKRALARVEDRFFPKPPGGFDAVYNAKTVNAVKAFQHVEGITPTGAFGQKTLDALEPYFDAYGRWKYRTVKLPPPPKPPLVEPVQGFDSLHVSLWEAYAIGRRMGLTDLGTYNPSSRLPSGAPSDHAVYPAYAFDLGIEPDTGWDNLVARAYFKAMIGRPEIEYVILGDKIASATQNWTVRLYSGGGHANHVHVSGRR